MLFRTFRYKESKLKNERSDETDSEKQPNVQIFRSKMLIYR